MIKNLQKNSEIPQITNRKEKRKAEKVLKTKGKSKKKLNNMIDIINKLQQIQQHGRGATPSTISSKDISSGKYIA